MQTTITTSELLAKIAKIRFELNDLEELARKQFKIDRGHITTSFLDRLLLDICDAFNMSRHELCGGRNADKITARMLFYYVGIRLGASKSQLSRMTNRHHSTAIYHMSPGKFIGRVRDYPEHNEPITRILEQYAITID